MTLKVPPPPTLPQQFQQLNRWLLELQSILNSQGNIDPSSVVGLPALFTQVAALATQVAVLASEVATNTTDIATNTSDIVTNTADIASNAAAIAALQANAVILNGAGVPSGALGSDGDLYINNTGSAGSFLYGRIAGVWTAFA